MTDRGVALITSRSFGGGEADVAGRLTRAGLRVAYGPRDHTPSALTPDLKAAVAWIAGTGPVTEEHLAAAPRLRVLARYGTGVDAVDLAAAARRGVAVTNTPGANAASVAEHAVTLMLAALRDLVGADRCARSGGQPPRRGRELGALTVGLVGLGTVGRSVAGRLAGFGCRVLAHDPQVPARTIANAGAEASSGPADLAARSDIVSLHLPGGDGPLVDDAFLDRVPRGALLVNTARADLVDETAVARALSTGRLAGAAVDVYSGTDSPLLAAPNVIATPHVAAHTGEAIDRMGSTAVDDVLRVLAGHPPRHPVTPRSHLGSRPPAGPCRYARIEERNSRVRNQAVMEFIGVTTSQSSVLRLFPQWAEVLGLHSATLVGTDLPLHAPPQTYRETVDRIAADPAVAGGLVTSHKVGLFDAASDRFAEIDPYARLCAEISCVSKRDGKLIGHAKDPITAQRALSALLDEDHFRRTSGHALCLGTGGAGLALAAALLEREDRPERLVLTDTRPERLEAARALHRRLARPAAPQPECAEAARTDRLLAELPEDSLIVNATGMGKDIPGSPVGPNTRFPARAICWDLNYRGDLLFLQQARRQASRRRLRVADGWEYFLHGWTEHIAEVFGLAFTPELFDRLRAASEGTTSPEA